MKHLALFAVLASAGFAAALNQPGAPVAPVAVAPVLGGAATGKVVLDGEKPEVQPLTIEKEKYPNCGDVSTVNESVLVDEKGGIANVVITVEVAGVELKVPEKPIELDQKSCRFDPHITVVPVGATVEFVNSDKDSHNVHTYPGKNDAMNKTIAVGGKETQKLDREDRIEVKCDIHPWMTGHIIVANTNFYAVTGADGSFKIEGLPPGTHKAKLWHETFGKADGEIVVGADGSAAPVEFKMKAEKKGGGRRRG